MKSRTSTRAPGRSAVSLRAAPARFCQAWRNVVGVDGVAAVGVDLEVQVRRGGLGVAGVADVAEDRAGLDVAVVDRGGREGGEVGVEELVAAVGVDPQAVAGDRQASRRSRACRRRRRRPGCRSRRRGRCPGACRFGAEGVERRRRSSSGRRPGRRSCAASAASCSRRLLRRLRGGGRSGVGAGVRPASRSRTAPATARRGRWRWRRRRRPRSACRRALPPTSSVRSTVSPAPPSLATTVPPSNV